MSLITLYGTTPDIFSISSKDNFFPVYPLINDEHVYNVFILLLRSPSEISIRASSTLSDSISIFSFLHIISSLYF